MSNWGSWKTGAFGAVPLVGAAASLIAMAAGTMPPDGNVIITDFGLIGAGLVGMFAKDHNVSNSPVPVPAKVVDPTPTPQRFGGAG